MPAAWSHFRPVTPLPAFAGLLGTRCDEDYGQMPIVICGAGRASIVSFRDWAAIVGEPADAWYSQHLPVFSYPPAPLASTRRYEGRRLDLYADGPYLWLKIVGYGSAALLIVDRRLLSATNRVTVRDWLKLRPGESIYRDADLRAAVLRFT